MGPVSGFLLHETTCRPADRASSYSGTIPSSAVASIRIAEPESAPSARFTILPPSRSPDSTRSLQRSRSRPSASKAPDPLPAIPAYTRSTPSRFRSAARCSRICSTSAVPIVPLPSWTRESLTAMRDPRGPDAGASAAPRADQTQGGPAGPSNRRATDVQPVVNRPHAFLHVASPEDDRDVVLGRSLRDRHHVHPGVSQGAERASRDAVLALHPCPDDRDGAHVALD